VLELHLTRPSAAGAKRFWFVVESGDVDLCLVPVGREVDVLVVADLKALTQVWMGDVAWERAGIEVSGPPHLVARVPRWIGSHPVLATVGPATSEV
jgi:hypothetical protein